MSGDTRNPLVFLKLEFFYTELRSLYGTVFLVFKLNIVLGTQLRSPNVCAWADVIRTDTGGRGGLRGIFPNKGEQSEKCSAPQRQGGRWLLPVMAGQQLGRSNSQQAAMFP